MAIRHKLPIIAATVAVLLLLLGVTALAPGRGFRPSLIFLTHGISGDGFVPGRELRLKCVDSAGSPVEGVRVEYRVDGVATPFPGTGEAVITTGADGMAVAPVGCRGMGFEERTYLWGLAKLKTSSEFSGSGRSRQYFWGAVGQPPHEAERMYAVTYKGSDIARYSERDLTSMPVAALIPLTGSIFADNPNATYFTTNGQVEALEMELTVP